MKRLCLLSLIAIPLLVVRSDEPVPQGFEHWTPATLQRTACAVRCRVAGVQCSKPCGTGSSDLTTRRGMAIKDSRQSLFIVFHLGASSGYSDPKQDTYDLLNHGGTKIGAPSSKRRPDPSSSAWG